MEKISWSDAKKHGNGTLFKNHAIKGSVESWRHKRGVGGSPNARVAMVEVIPFEKVKKEKYCQCKDAVVNSLTYLCDKCGGYFDVAENKKLKSYRIIGI